MFKRSGLTLIVIALLSIFFAAAPASAANFTVTSLNDSGAGTLRQAITDANTSAGSDTITFGISGTITLASTLPTIDGDITINGSGQNIILSGNTSVRVLRVNTGALLTLSNLKVINGRISGNGAGIYNQGGLVITNVTVSGNATTGLNNLGGGIANDGGSLTITSSTLSGNAATSGGGIANISGTVTIANSTFSGNSVSGVGSNGGGLFVQAGTLTMYNSTVASNTFGGVGNGGGGITQTGGTVTVNGSIISNTNNCSGTIGGSNNLMYPTACGTAAGTIADPLLAALADNGGSTQTHALTAGSPARDTLTTTCPAMDQRGTNRPQGSSCDIGAFELVPPVLALTAPTGTITTDYGNPIYTWTFTGATSYELAVWKSDYSSLIYYGQNLASAIYCNTTTCSIEPTTQPTSNASARLNNGNYYGFVRAGTGTWMGPFPFTLNAPAPSPVTMGSTTNTNTFRPTFNWTAVGNATTFRLYVIPKALFDAGNYTATLDQWYPRAERCGSLTGTTCSLLSPVDLQDNTNYYVYIQAYGPGGFSQGGQYNNGWSGTEFRVDTVPDPAVPSGTTVNRNQGRPTINWNDDSRASRFYIAIYNNTAGQWAYGAWHEKTGTLLCNGTTCSLTSDAMIFANGEYSVYIGAEGPGGSSTGGPFNNGFNGPSNFSLNFAPPFLVTNLNANAVGNNISVSFMGVEGATYYRIFLGTYGAAQIYHHEWYSSTVLNCQNPTTCATTITLSEAIPPGTVYYLAVQSAGPGGYSSGGPVNNGYAVSDGFTAP